MQGDNDETGEPERGVSLTSGDGHKRSAIDRRLGLGLPDWFQSPSAATAAVAMPPVHSRPASTFGVGPMLPGSSA